MQSNQVLIRTVDQGNFNSADITEYSNTIKVHTASYITKLDNKIDQYLISNKLPKQVYTDSQLRSMTIK